MAHLPVTLTLLFIAGVCAAPVPEPDKPKFAVVKDSSFGLGAADGGSKAHGVVDGNSSVEAPFPGDTGDDVPDVALVDDVNVGAAFAGHGSVATGVVKNNKFADGFGGK